MFRYYQETPTSKWAYVVDSPKSIQDLIDEKIPMMSVLSVKAPIESDEDKKDTSYKGDFYVDIDHKDIADAITAAKLFNDKLIAKGASGYTVFLSGKKGFHFIVPQECFSSGRPVKHLPLVYKEMAFDMYVDGVDMAVYNEGRPRLLRTPNVERLDNKKYKVSIAIEELETLTPESYAELTSTPRLIQPAGTVKHSIRLETLYEACKSRVAKKLRAMKDVEFVPSDELAKTIGPKGELPGCINILLEKGDTKTGANFNQATMQFAAFMTRAGVKEWDQHAKQMAHNVKSSSYNSEYSRHQAIKKMVSYVAGSRNFGFSKAALFSVIEPCRDCDICNGTIEDGEIIPEGHEEESDVEETPQGYYTGFGKTRKKLTTFTLDIVSKFTEQLEEEYGETRIGTNAVIKVNGHKRQKVIIPEEAWISNREFKQTFKGKEGYAFYGTDLDLQKLQNKLFSDTTHIAEICHVHSVGMHRHKVGGRTILVYAEPGFSVSSTKEKGTHEVWGNIPASPQIQSAVYPEPTEDLKKFIDNMLGCNSPEVTSSIVSWMALAHVKVQLTMRSSQFPLLNLWGNCMDRDTEFLTPTGWKKIGDYSVGDKVAEWSPDGTINFKLPIDYIKQPAAELNHIKTKTIDMVVSDNHGIPYYTYKNNLVTKPFSELKDMYEIVIPRGFTLSKTKDLDLSDELLRVLIMQSADGHIEKGSVNWHPMIINVKKEGKKKRVKILLEAAGIDYTVHCNRDGYARYRYHMPEPIRTKSLNMLWGCSTRQFHIVCDEMVLWDGHLRIGTGFKIFTGNKENTDLCQFALSITTGCFASIYDHGKNNWTNHRVYRVNQSKQDRSVIKLNDKVKPRVSKYKTLDGYQYCFTTESGFWLARREGKIFPTHNSGAGKSALSGLFAGLHAVDYELEHSPISLQGTTPWAVAQYCTTSESTPRLIEEFNAGEIPSYKYDQFTGLLKAAFGMETFARGGMESKKVAGINVSGAKVLEAKISAPLVVMSEQAPDRPALRQRMIQVNVNRKGREDEAREDAFYYLMDHKPMFYSLARAMVWQSLTTHPETVYEMMESYKPQVPRAIDTRPRYAYQGLLTGAEFFGRTLRSIGLDEEYVAEKVAFMQGSILSHLKDTAEDVRREKLTTEVVLVLTEMCMQADIGRQATAIPWPLLQGVDYFKTDQFLYLDARKAHSKYVRWARSGGTKVILTAFSQFDTLLKQEDFYVNTVIHPDLGEGKLPIAKLSIKDLSERGIPIELFEGDNE